MSSKLYRVTMVIQEEVLAESEAEAFKFLLHTALEHTAPLALYADELPVGTGDVYSDAED